MSYVPTSEFDMAEVQALFAVNVFGAMSMVKEFTPLLIASGDGRIVQISSVAAFIPTPYSGIYNASKAALQAYGNTARLELAPFNVKVTNV